MSCTRTVGARSILTKQPATQVLRVLNGSIQTSSLSRPACIALSRQNQGSSRQFSTTNRRKFKSSGNWLIQEFFPAPKTSRIPNPDAAWPHPIYNQEQKDTVTVAHRDAKTWSDYVALGSIRTMRWVFDLLSGYRHSKAVALNEKDPAAAKQKYYMSERKYMIRNIFLESVAGELPTTSLWFRY